MGFRQLSARETGLDFANRIPPSRYLTNQVFLNGSGIALGDVNGDGRPDVFAAGLAGGSRLFLNLGGWRFTNATDRLLPPAIGRLDVSGCVLVDVDGDGTRDLIFNTYAQGTWIYRNDGQGRFSPAGPPLNDNLAGASLALADVDGDGDLDLYVTNYRLVSMRDEPGGRFTMRHEDGQPHVVAYNGRAVTEPDLMGRFYVTPGGVKENGQPDTLYLNDGRGNFTPVSWTDGVFLDEQGRALSTPPYDWGLSAMFRDLNGDGRPDLYVCNDFESPDRFWLNETPPGGPPRFRAAGSPVVRVTSAFSMGIDVADINRDGQDDFFVADMLSRDHLLRNMQVDGLPANRFAPGVLTNVPQFSRNTLFLARGDGTFAEVGRLAGVSASEWSWTPAFLDVDLDGWEDLLVTNGHEMDMMDADRGEEAERAKAQRRMNPRELLELRKMFRRFNAPNAAFRNRGDLSFEDVSEAWGFALPSVAHGLALADLDGDHDLDVVINCLNDTLAVFRNEASAPRLAVRLRGAAPNTAGAGARIIVRGGAVPVQSQVVISGGRYLSGDDGARVFATGTAGTVDVEVRWLSGRTTRIEGAKPGTTLTVEEINARSESRPVPAPAPPPLFRDVSPALNHRHEDPVFDDLARQPLLPRSLAQGGPGLAWADLDGNGTDDLVIGTGAGGRIAVFAGDGSGGFARMSNAPLQRTVSRDLAGLVPGGAAIFAGVTPFEAGLTNVGILHVVNLARNATGEALRGEAFAAGPLALADLDGDGPLELLVGGRTMPGAYPVPSPSLIIDTGAGRLEERQRLNSLGVVHGALFTDVTGDALPDLVISAEWSPLRVFRNEGGRLVEATTELGLTETTGWWNSVQAADFDGDDRMDLVAGNAGWNHFPGPRAPLEGTSGGAADRRLIRWGDLDGDGSVDVIESYFDASGRELPVRRFDAMVKALPFLRGQFASRESFGAAAVRDIFGERLARLSVGEARWFASTVFLNRGDRFEPRPLPVEAQFAPVFGLAAGDFDGDGHDDIICAQNFFPVHPEDARQDAGRGLMLKGDGRGNFVAMPARASGFVVDGEGRGLAAADFDRDGRLDLAVGQNAAATLLFRNEQARPGLRVRVQGPPQNPTGIGARLRLLAGQRGGPTREVRTGGGYWSVDSATLILTHPDQADTLTVRWPDGAAQTWPVPEGVREVVVSRDAPLRIAR